MSGDGLANGTARRPRKAAAGKAPRPAAAGSRTLALRSGGSVRLSGGAGAETLSIRGADGSVQLEVHLGPAGPVLRFGGDRVSIEAPGELALSCRTFEVRSESITLAASGRIEQRAGGSLELRAGGDAVLSADAVSVEGRSGEVALRANDDVALNGERVLLNCPTDEEVERSRTAAASIQELLERPFVVPDGPRRLAGSRARAGGPDPEGAP